MIKNFKDTVRLSLITAGVLILLGVIIVGDYLGSRSKENQSSR
jgi:hypothetical protein